MEEKNLKKRFVSNASWQMAQQIYSMILSLIIGSISARYLGPNNYGLLNYGESLISLMATLTGLGLDEVIMNELVMKKDKTGTLIGTALVMRLLASIVGVFAVAAIIITLEPGNKLLWVITILQTFQLFGNLYYVFNYWFQVELKSKYVSIAYIIGLTVSGVWRVVILMKNASVEFFAMTASIQGIVVLLIVAACFFSISHEKLHFEKNVAKELIRKSYHFIISGIAIMIYMQMDKVMIGKMLGEEQLGYSSAASKVANLWIFVPRALINSARPLIIEGKKIDEEKNSNSEYKNRLVKAVFGISMLGLFVGLCFTFFGWIPVRVLYGTAYSSAVPVLAILIWSTSLSQLGTINGIWIVTEGYNRLLKYTVWMGAFVNLALNYILIRIYGITGAAIATFMAQFTVQFIGPACIPSLRKYFEVYTSAFREIFNIKYYINAVRKKVSIGRKK